MAHEPGTVLKQLVELPKNPSECWKWLGYVDPNGIPRKQVNGKPIAARRWLWEQLFGVPLPGLEVFNVCGTHGCISPHHMRCGFSYERTQLGALAKLTPSDVAEIKRRKKAGPYEKQALAMKLGVPLKTLQAIWNGKQWANITKQSGELA